MESESKTECQSETKIGTGTQSKGGLQSLVAFGKSDHRRLLDPLMDRLYKTEIPQKLGHRGCYDNVWIESLCKEFYAPQFQQKGFVLLYDKEEFTTHTHFTFNIFKNN